MVINELNMLHTSAIIIHQTLSVFCIPDHLKQRSLADMQQMMQCAIPSMDAASLFEKYNCYGCYCGFGSSGGKPVDEIDKCCMLHDKCYSKVEAKSSCLEKFLFISIHSIAYKIPVKSYSPQCLYAN